MAAEGLIDAPPRSRQLGFPLFLTTASVLTLELSLTRLFSVVLFYHYAFLVISIALLGLATGAIAARQIRWTGTGRMAMACLLAAVSLVPLLFAILNTDIWLVTPWQAFGTLSSLYLLCMIPFAFAGFVISSVMRAGSDRISTLYFFDLFGAACGAILFVPMIDVLGGPNTVLAVGGLWSCAAIAWAVIGRARRVMKLSLLLFVAIVLAVVFNRRGALFDVQFLRGAPRKNELFAKWNSFSRISVYRSSNNTLWVEIDGGAGTMIPRIDFRGEGGRIYRANLGRYSPDLGFLLTPRPHSLIIGAGGGIDIARAVAAGSPSITAVEINPIIARDVMTGRFWDYSERLYTRPEVRVVIEDGRTFVQRTKERYDTIQMSQVDTWATSAAGAYALTENYLYTVEAIEDYVSKLTPEGGVSITRWEFTRPRETLRLVSIALEALDRLKVLNPEQHIVVVLEALNKVQTTGTVLIRNRPFTSDEVDVLRRRMPGTAMRIAYAPGDRESTGPFAALILSSDRRAFIAHYPYDIRPVFDDKPFFFFTGRWSNFWQDVFAFDISGDALNTGAQFLLLALLIASFVAVCIFLFAPLLLFHGGGRARLAPAAGETPALLFLLFAVAVGVGFILVEVSLIQKFVVFLGQPVYSLTVVIFLLLVASGLGSRVSSRFRDENLPRTIRMVTVAIAVVIVGGAFLTGALIRAYQPAAIEQKVALVALVICPLGFLMGMPFPSGLRLAALSGASIEWVWALNAAATVLGSVLAIFLAVTLGIMKSMFIGGLAYGGAAFLASRMDQQK
ncbi:MAG TPA: hypothetical protein VII12_17470 [Thermoanaerobaculia bacterium]